MKKKICSLLLAGAMVCGAAQAAPSAERETIAQVTLLQSLAQGYFDGVITVGELKKLGDTGIGTFEGLNGEMIVLDGKVFQALGSGQVVKAEDSVKVPFSNVTFFDKDIVLKLTDIADKDALEAALNQVVKENGENSFYMVKMHTKFPHILYRSEYASREPYPTLVQALQARQTEFEGKDIKGTLVGLYCPSYMGQLNSIGWHFHFISDDEEHGGHVLALTFKEGEAQLDKTDKFTMILSKDQRFQGLNLAKDMTEDIHSAEHDTQTAMTGSQES